MAGLKSRLRSGAMDSFKARLHPRVIVTPEHRAFVQKALLSSALQGRMVLQGIEPPAEYLEISLTTVSLDSNFDASIDISFEGADAGSTTSLLLDSGNSVLIVPRWEDIAALPNAGTDYRILGTGPEPWGCPANIVQGPIKLATTHGQTVTLNNCVFYACTGGPPAGGDRTANFGAGCLSPWSGSGWNTPAGIPVAMQAPLSYNTDYPYAEFSYAPLDQVLGARGTPTVTTDGSYLRLYKALPDGYQMMAIIPQLEWMALKAEGLSIGGVQTLWPGTIQPQIAMIDTGGGPVFLSDPSGLLYDKQWPDPVANPLWTSSSVNCQSSRDSIEVQLGDGTTSISYAIDPSSLPAAVQGLTLVMCETNAYMMGQQGMNIGGISALVNYVLVDYRDAQVGLKAK
jgi:hypothetical protein